MANFYESCPHFEPIELTPEASREIVREKWRMAKRAQRARGKATALPICPVFREAVSDERDRRARSASRASRLINGVHVEVAGRLSYFAAEVWAARVLLRAEWGQGADTPTKIARWLRDEGRAGEYAQSSVRPRTYAAIEVIKDLERHGPTYSDPPFWQPWQFAFDKKAAEADSG